MRTFARFAKLAITLGLLAYLWFMIDPAATWAQIRQCNPWLLAAGTLVLGLLPVLGAVRWRLILNCLGVPSRFRLVARWTYISVFFSQVLPATVGGDGLRMWLAHRAGCVIKAAVNSVGLDRIAMLLSLVLLLAMVLPGLQDLIEVRRLDYLMPLLIGGSFLSLAAVLLGDRLPERLRTLRAVRAIGYLAHDARQLFLSPKHIGAVLALSLISYFTIISSVCLFAWALGATFDLSQAVVLLPPVLVASSLPISIGGWGTREMAMVAALGTLGIAPHTAVLVSLWLGVASIIISLPGAFLYLTDRVPFGAPPEATELHARW